MSKLLLATVLLTWSCLGRSEDAAIAGLFSKAGLDGTLLIESVNGGQRFVHNDMRSKQPFTAASTFKVFHTLIALEEGVIAGAESTFRWDGTRYGIAAWNHDQTLETAFKVSCVWCYQQLARRIGVDTYPPYLHLAHYGQLRKPFHGTEFWLDGSLTINAEQQVAFLRQVVERRLPLQAHSYDTLKSIMLSDTGPGYRLYAKTGWAARTTPGIGWYVGYVETAVDTWLFALNLDTHNAADLPLRQQIAIDALRLKGILQAEHRSNMDISVKTEPAD
jgi:beta-lactamase class D